MIIEVSDGKFIEYNEEKNTAVVMDYVLVQEELKKINARLEEIPLSPTDEVLLAWAKENYPRVDYTVEKDTLMARKKELEKFISQMEK